MSAVMRRDRGAIVPGAATTGGQAREGDGDQCRPSKLGGPAAWLRALVAGEI
jgi:hypothetical protein